MSGIAHWQRILTSEVELSNRFESVKRTIYGIGFTCVVVMGINKLSKEEVAIKVILKSKLHSIEELERARTERQIHSTMSHPNMLPLLGGEETTESIILITPLAKGDLQSVSANKVFSESNARRLSRQLISGLAYMHSLGYFHGDIKPHNILLFENVDSHGSKKCVAKFCDFGFTQKIGEHGVIPFTGMRGSLGFFAPEQLKRQSYGQPVDMFALGVVIYTLLCGYEPFYPSNKAGQLNGDEEHDASILLFEPPYWDRISVPVKKFVRGLLHGDPAKRLTAQQALFTEWLSMEDTADVADPLAEDRDIQFE